MQCDVIVCINCEQLPRPIKNNQRLVFQSNNKIKSLLRKPNSIINKFVMEECF